MIQFSSIPEGVKKLIAFFFISIRRKPESECFWGGANCLDPGFHRGDG